MNRKIFVTGATGFVGLHLLRFLESSQNQIFGTSYPQEPQVFDGVCENDICRLDIRHQEQICTAIEKSQPDWVFHLAAVSNVRDSWENKTETIETNLLGTLNVLEAVKAVAPRSRVLFVSSSNVYAGRPPDSRGFQEDDSTRAVSPYAYTKLCGELLCRFYVEVESLDIVISRSFPHTGPGQSPDFVCSDWARQIVEIELGLSDPVIRVGNIDVQRDFTDVEDVVKAYALLLEKGRNGETYNVASGKAVPLRNILNRFLSLTSATIQIQIDEKRLRRADIPILIGNSHKLREETGWEPRIPLDQTLSSLLTFWRERLDAADQGGSS